MRSALAASALSVVAMVAGTPVTAVAHPSANDSAAAGTTRVDPSMAACGNHGYEQALRCGAAFTDAWLTSQGLADVVAQTVIVQPGTLSAWRSSTTGTVCGFADFGPIALGMHHCHGVTYANPVVDKALFSTDNELITVLAHESAHGVQERAGINTTLLTVTGSAQRIEKSADCWAGVAMRWYVREGMITNSAVPQARALMRRSGGASREVAFLSGYRSGPSSCNTILGRKVFPQKVI